MDPSILGRSIGYRLCFCPDSLVLGGWVIGLAHYLTLPVQIKEYMTEYR